MNVLEMLRLKYLVATCVLALTVGAANANTITTFDVNGSFDNPVATLSGTLTVDVTAGNVTNADFILTYAPLNLLPFTNISISGALGGQWFLRVYNADALPSKLDVTLALLPATGSLIGYNGSLFNNGVIFLGSNFNQISPNLSYASGTITPHIASTPLPAALPLFSTGLGLIGWLARRRKRKAAAALAAV